MLLEWFGTALGCSEGGESAIACYPASPGYGAARTWFLASLLVAGVYLGLLGCVAVVRARRRARGLVALLSVLTALLLAFGAVDFLARTPPRKWCEREGYVQAPASGGVCATSWN
ncbi:MAG: hypothetical protein J2O48_03030 [Solirubrobacterales bacterium]|nr:hypothetical protein [Solirubrobacterales bacterium]